ncbi:ELMO/CED-12 family protein [Striga asiatica]|uniref:ELMO/CED-12 family protein n=1 Tax=Striga asiatica TaxID=4170 RepID=A0A5A7QHP9_STRAF|nr:ELMO/CED-12 family protein [Striga asiatica]
MEFEHDGLLIGDMPSLAISSPNPETNPEAVSINTSTLNLLPSMSSWVMLRPSWGRFSEAMRSRLRGMKRELMGRMLLLTIRVSIGGSSMALESGGEEAERDGVGGRY